MLSPEKSSGGATHYFRHDRASANAADHPKDSPDLTARIRIEGVR
jgi:hypothetical protein